MKEGWEKENIEKSKKVLMDHFKRKKEEEMFKEMLRECQLSSMRQQPHFSTIGWDTEDSGFDEINDDFIWEDLTDSDNKKDKGSE